jgi:hypothetical protein
MANVEILVDEEFGTKVEKTKGDRMKWTRRFFCAGIPTDIIDAEIQAYMTIRSFISSKYPVLTSQRIQSLNVTEIETGVGAWRGECTFISPSEKDLLKQYGLPEYSFSTKGGTAHITHSRKTIKVYPGWRPEYYYEEKDGVKKLQIKRDEKGKPIIVKETVPDHKGGIGWNEDTATFEGVDIVVPSWKSTIKISVPNEYVDPLYLKMLRMITGAINSTPFDGMNPGECKFNGCDAARRIVPREKNEEEENESQEPQYDLIWDLTFDFEAAPNMKKWIDGIGYVTKRGWDYMHILRRMVDYPTDTVYLEDEPDDVDPVIEIVAQEDSETGTENPPNPDDPEKNEEQQEKEDKKQRKTYSAPVAAYIERVSPYVDFRVFGLGNGL